jgi:putative endonuclease
MPGFVYILASSTGTLYTGATDDLYRRITEHRNGIHSRFAGKYRCHRLVHWEQFATMREALLRESQIKGWTRSRKRSLVESTNPEWRDLQQGWGRRTLSPKERIADQADSPVLIR